MITPKAATRTVHANVNVQENRQEMCTTMRKLHRGTTDGTAKKLFHRGLKRRMLSVQNIMLNLKPNTDVSALIAELSALTRLRKAIKV